MNGDIQTNQWARDIGEVGEFRYIPKRLLKIDKGYQRGIPRISGYGVKREKFMANWGIYDNEEGA